VGDGLVAVVLYVAVGPMDVAYGAEVVVGTEVVENRELERLVDAEEDEPAPRPRVRNIEVDRSSSSPRNRLCPNAVDAVDMVDASADRMVVV